MCKGKTRSPQPRPRPRGGFTLIELLVVMGVIAMLTVISLGALNSHGSDLKHAGGLLADLSSMAHENALSQNSPTALLVVTNGLSTGGIDLNARAITLIQMDSQGQWSQISKWTSLPSTVLVTNSSGFTLPALPTATGSQILNFNGQHIDAVQSCVAYLFDTDGRLTATNTLPARLRVMAANGKADDYYELIFNANTGTFKINRP